MSSVIGGRWSVRLVHTVIIVAALTPVAWIGWDGLHDHLGANPIEEITHRTGDWTIRLLLATLAVSPLRRLTGWNIIRYRRTLGLLAFSYVCLHFLIYLAIDQGFPIQGFALQYVVEDIAKRPYITVGFTAFLLLIPLAWTSTKGWIRRLGKRWKALHQLIYVAGALGALHYLWLVKGDQPTPVYYALVLVVLLAIRALPRFRGAPRAGDRPPSPLPVRALDPS